MDLLQTTKFKCSVSSVLNKDIKQNGKQFLYDQQPDTAWSSNEGVPQWISIQFEEPQTINEFVFQFQGGFAGKDCVVIIESKEGNKLIEEPFYPEDINAIQHFKLKTPVATPQAAKIKFLFNACTDFFGRIIVYQLQIF